MKSSKLVLAFFFFTALAFPQAIRFDTVSYTTSPSCVSGKLCPVLAIPGTTVNVCQGTAASLAACQNAPATTYTGATASTPCANTSQLTPATGGSCLTTSDNQGNFGFWALPGAYSYFLSIPSTAGGGTYGPYPFTVHGDSGGYVYDANYQTLQAAITAAGSGTLYVTKAWPGISSAITLSAPISIVCIPGTSTITSGSSPITAFVITSPNVSITGCTIDGNSISGCFSSATGLSSGSLSYLTLTGTTCQHTATQWGLVSAGSTAAFTTQNITMRDTTWNDTGGIYLSSAGHIHMTNTSMNGLNGSGSHQADGLHIYDNCGAASAVGCDSTDIVIQTFNLLNGYDIGIEIQGAMQPVVRDYTARSWKTTGTNCTGNCYGLSIIGGVGGVIDHWNLTVGRGYGAQALLTYGGGGVAGCSITVGGTEPYDAAPIFNFSGVQGALPRIHTNLVGGYPNACTVDEAGSGVPGDGVIQVATIVPAMPSSLTTTPCIESGQQNATYIAGVCEGWPVGFAGNGYEQRVLITGSTFNNQAEALNYVPQYAEVSGNHFYNQTVAAIAGMTGTVIGNDIVRGNLASDNGTNQYDCLATYSNAYPPSRAIGNVCHFAALVPTFSGVGELINAAIPGTLVDDFTVQSFSTSPAGVAIRNGAAGGLANSTVSKLFGKNLSSNLSGNAVSTTTQTVANLASGNTSVSSLETNNLSGIIKSPAQYCVTGLPTVNTGTFTVRSDSTDCVMYLVITAGAQTEIQVNFSNTYSALTGACTATQTGGHLANYSAYSNSPVPTTKVIIDSSVALTNGATLTVQCSGMQ